VRIVVGTPAGGATDIPARLIGQWLSERLGQPVVVENRPGASTNIATEAVVRSAPDGHTLLAATPANTVNATLYDKLNFSFIRDIAPVASIMRVPNVMVVNPSFPARSVRDFIDYGKANPGKLNFGSAGHGNATHLAAELFKLKTGIDIVHIPYKGAAEAVTGVLSGQVQLFFGDIGGVLPLMREGTLRALAVSSETRNALVPELPTMIESGVPDYVVLTYIGVVAPAGTPASILARLNAAINESLAAPDVAAAFAKIGAEVKPASAQDFAAFLAAETRKWTQVAKAANLKIE
jgi:tripartite-type tricarboxylate transporter receptor subunit TctC